MLTENEINLIRLGTNVACSRWEKDSPYALKGEALFSALESAGLKETYDKWDKELKENGFNSTPIYMSDINSKILMYRYSGDFSVRGDHAYDTFTLYAYLTEGAVYFDYTSSNLDYHFCYTVIGDDFFKDRLDSYLEKNRHFFFGNSKHKFEIYEIDYSMHFIYKKDDPAYLPTNIFTKLAVMLDFELSKRYAFHTVFEYEKREKEFLKQTLDGAVFSHPGFLRDSDEIIMMTIIGCSFEGSRFSAIENAEAALAILTEKNEFLRPKLLQAVDELRAMTDEDFMKLKLDIFDL